MILLLSRVGAYFSSNTALLPLAINCSLNVKFWYVPVFVILSNLAVTLIFLNRLFPSTAIAFAGTSELVFPPTKLIIGALVYPDP